MFKSYIDNITYAAVCRNTFVAGDNIYISADSLVGNAIYCSNTIAFLLGIRFNFVTGRCRYQFTPCHALAFLAAVPMLFCATVNTEFKMLPLQSPDVCFLLNTA